MSFPDFGDDFRIGRAPIFLLKSGDAKPSFGRMNPFFDFKPSLFHPSVKDVHIEDELGVFVDNIHKEAIDGDDGVEFFFNLADECSFRSFPRFNLAARKLPFPFQKTIVSLRTKNHAIFANDGSDDLKLFLGQCPRFQNHIYKPPGRLSRE